MSDNPHAIQSVAILGGGAAGWMAAAVLAKALERRVAITLVESEAIGAVGVGEATIPQIHHINRFLGFDENEFVRSTQASFKLGIEFDGWTKGGRYLHAFGDIGMPLGFAPFHHYWLRARAAGEKRALWDFSINARAAARNRFQRLERIGTSRLGGVKYAFHFDAALYGAFLRRAAEANGVRRREGAVKEVALDGETGRVTALRLADGGVVEADFFIDCSGFRALIIGDALGVPFEDWTQWLPCDRAVAAPCRHGDDFRPYTQASAREAGWQWRIPLQHRVGNGHVYASAYMSDDEAARILLDHLEGEPLAEPRIIRFRTGMRAQLWAKNCVALGLAGGFMEPLESTSIHLIQSCVSRLVSMFPDRRFDDALIAEFNRQTRFEFEKIRDFLILHYHANDRDGAFWRDCRRMTAPEAVIAKMSLFAADGRIFREREELFTETGWLQVLLGQGVSPGAYHPLADNISDDQLQGFFADLDRLLGGAVEAMPTHAEFIASHCKAANP